MSKDCDADTPALRAAVEKTWTKGMLRLAIETAARTAPTGIPLTISSLLGTILAALDTVETPYRTRPAAPAPADDARQARRLQCLAIAASAAGEEPSLLVQRAQALEAYVEAPASD